MRRVLLGLLLVLLNASTSYAKPFIPNFRLTVLCFGEEPDCFRSIRVAHRAVRLLEPQIPARLKIVSVREMDLPEAPPPLEIRLAQPIAARIAFEDHSDLVLFISPKADTYILGVSLVGVMGIQPAATISHLIPSEKLSVDIVAHEIAHSMGARHEFSGLMTPAISDRRHSSFLSAQSRLEIRQFLDATRVHISDPDIRTVQS